MPYRTQVPFVLCGLAGNTTYTVRFLRYNLKGWSGSTQLNFVSAPLVPAVVTDALRRRPSW